MVDIRKIPIQKRRAIYLPKDLCDMQGIKYGAKINVAVVNGILFMHSNERAIMTLANLFSVQPSGKLSVFVNEFLFGRFKNKDDLWEYYTYFKSRTDWGEVR